MPYKFALRVGDHAWSCQLHCRRCVAQSASTARRCRNRVCIGLDTCWTHTRTLKHLRVGPSNLPGAGKGLFGFDGVRREGNPVLFRRGETVCEYGGERLPPAELHRRVPGRATGPYQLCDLRVCEDGACVRGLGTLANGFPHRRGTNVEYALRGGRLVLVATRAIRPGDEVLAYYGRDYAFDVEHHTR